jgi:WD40 repeat protein
MQAEFSIGQQKLSNVRLLRPLVVVLTVLFTVGVITAFSWAKSQRSDWDRIGQLADYAQFSPDERIIATASLDGIFLWDVSDGRLLDSLGDSSLTPQLAFTHDGRFFSWTHASYAFFYSMRNTRMAYTPVKAKSWIYALAMSPDNNTVATGGGTVELWNLFVGEAAHHTVADIEDSAAYALAFSDDGKLLAAGTSDGSVYAWQVETGGLPNSTDFKTTQLFSATTHIGAVTQLAISPDKSALAAGDASGKFVLLSMQDGHLLSQSSEPGEITRLAFSPNSKLVAVGYSPKVGVDGIPQKQPNQVSAWRVSDGVHVWTSEVGPDVIANIKFSPDAKSLIVGYYDRSVRTLKIP